jgi:RNA polymerase sigma-70 factor (ECF subfamily)
MDHLKEQALMERARQGDAEAFGEIYDAYAPKLYLFIYYKVHHREVAQDLLADTFMRALRAVPRYDAKLGGATAWLYAIARNLVIDHYRRSRPQVSVDDAWDLQSGDHPAARADFRLKVERVRTHLQSFSAIERDIVLMRVWQEMSYAEIAAALGKSEDACKVSFSRSLKKLQAAMSLGVLLAFIISKP